MTRAAGVAEPVVVDRTDSDPRGRLEPTSGPKSVFFSDRHPPPDQPGSERGRALLRELRGFLEADGWAVRFDEQALQDGDSISAFADRTATVAYPECGLQNDHRRAECVRGRRTLFAGYDRDAADFALDPRPTPAFTACGVGPSGSADRSRP